MPVVRAYLWFCRGTECRPEKSRQRGWAVARPLFVFFCLVIPFNTKYNITHTEFREDETMCGIVGYIGREEAAPILLDGLSRLEYRGYDSAGIAV